MANSASTLHDLAAVVSGDVESAADPTSVRIHDVTHDSRQAGEGALFVAIRGSAVDGHVFVPEAIARGVAAVCVDRRLTTDVAQLIVDNTRSALGPLAAAVHHHPSHEMTVVGVTGTNGKTTVTHYIESLASHAGVSTGLIGTINIKIGGTTLDAIHTTPEASDFQRLLAAMRDSGTTLVAAEVSSHALEMGRVAATEFAVAGFTNLSQDHLDFHGDMDRYLSAKRRLFNEFDVATAVINVDDPAGVLIAESFSGDVVTVGRDAQCRHSNARSSVDGTEFRLDTPWGGAQVRAPVIGRFNLDNTLLAVACSLAAGVPFDDVTNGLPELAGVPGRYEVVSGDDPITVIVDYAHTPEGIAEAISVARGLGKGRVIAVMGAGGDRDRDKRPLMGQAASSADLAVITSDNPRSEDPEKIVESVLSGLDPSVESLSEIDRRKAIQRAVASASSGDVVLVLGRGHEPVQDVGGQKVPFDDRQVARDALEVARKSTDSDINSGSMGP